MSTVRLYFRALLGTFFLKVFLEQDCKKILVLCFDVYNDGPFPEKYTVKDHINDK